MLRPCAHVTLYEAPDRTVILMRFAIGPNVMWWNLISRDQVAGAAGAATLKVLRQLGLVKLCNRENNYLVDVYIVSMRHSDDGDDDDANNSGQLWTQRGSTR